MNQYPLPPFRDGRLVWINAGYATFGLVLADGRVVDAPPIAVWTLGQAEHKVAAYYRSRGASFMPIDANDNEQRIEG